jgi:hypothetical protein
VHTHGSLNKHTKETRQQNISQHKTSTNEGGGADPGGGPPPPASGIRRTFSEVVNSGLAPVGQLFPNIAPVTRSRLLNALTFDLSKHAGIKYLRQAGMYQFGFRKDIDVAEVIHDGFSINGQVVPKFRCYREIENIVRVTLFGLISDDEDGGKQAATEVLGRYGKVLQLDLLRDSITGYMPGMAVAHLDVTPISGSTYLELKPIIEIQGEQVVLKWPQRPVFCTYCVVGVCE